MGFVIALTSVTFSENGKQLNSGTALEGLNRFKFEVLLGRVSVIALAALDARR